MYSQRKWKQYFEETLHSLVHCSLTHNSQDIEITQGFTDRLTDKEYICIHTYIILYINIFILHVYAYMILCFIYNVYIIYTYMYDIKQILFNLKKRKSCPLWQRGWTLSEISHRQTDTVDLTYRWNLNKSNSWKRWASGGCHGLAYGGKGEMLVSQGTNFQLQHGDHGECNQFYTWKLLRQSIFGVFPTYTQNMVNSMN